MSIANLEHEYFPQLNANILNARVLFARDIDANTDFGSTLFLGSNPTTTDIQLGAVGGHPITIIPGVFCTQMNAGGTLGVGPVLIGNQSETTAVIIGNLSSNTNVLGNFSLPSSTLTPLLISDSFAQQSIITGVSGVVAASGVFEIVYYKINNMATLFVKFIPPSLNSAVPNNPMIITTLLPVGVRPSVPITFSITVMDGANTWVLGRCSITAGGQISIGNVGSIIFTTAMNNPVATADFSITYVTP